MVYISDGDWKLCPRHKGIVLPIDHKHKLVEKGVDDLRILLGSQHVLKGDILPLGYVAELQHGKVIIRVLLTKSQQQIPAHGFTAVAHGIMGGVPGRENILTLTPLQHT